MIWILNTHLWVFVQMYLFLPYEKWIDEKIFSQYLYLENKNIHGVIFLDKNMRIMDIMTLGLCIDLHFWTVYMPSSSK